MGSGGSSPFRPAVVLKLTDRYNSGVKATTAEYSSSCLKYLPPYGFYLK